jgi:hypothetical protein
VQALLANQYVRKQASKACTPKKRVQINLGKFILKIAEVTTASRYAAGVILCPFLRGNFNRLGRMNSPLHPLSKIRLLFLAKFLVNSLNF